MPNWKKVVVSGSDAALSSLNVTGTITAGTFAGLISQSSQVNHNATTNYVANQHIDHTTVSITAGSGLTGGGDISANRTITVGAGLGMTVNADDIAVNTGSTHFTNGVKAKLNTDQVLSGSVSSPSQGTISVGGFTNIDLGLQSGDSPTFAGVTATNFTGTASRATIGERVDIISGGSTTGLGVYSGSFSGSFIGLNQTSGTVTSVGLSLPNIFTVTNSPVTSAGTLTGTLASQTQNTVFAAPNGSNGTPTFRSLVAADIPTLNQNTTGTAAAWTTARTLTIGATGKSVDGTGNVSWTLAEIGALGASAKAADSNLLDGYDSLAFAAQSSLMGGVDFQYGGIGLSTNNYTLSSATTDTDQHGRYYYSGTSGQIVTRYLPVDKNGLYRMKIRWKTSLASVTYIAVFLLDTSGNNINGAGTYYAYPWSGANSPTSWTENEYWYNGSSFPSNAAYVAFGISHTNYTGQGATYYVSQLEIERINTTISGNTIWHAGNDGASSGLDADLLDGQQGSYYAAASSLSSYLPLAGGTMTGTIVGVSGTDVSFNGGGLSTANSYNYVLSGANDTGNKLVIFVNGSTRTADGGVNTVTMRNDGGNLILGGSAGTTDIKGTSVTANGTAISLTGHTHAISDVTGLQTALDGKAATGQTFFIGTTQVAINRTSAALSLTGVNIDGSAGSVAWSSISGHRTLGRDNAGLQGDAGARSGFFETSTPTNYYTGATSWQHLIESRHTNDTNNYAMQLAGSFFDQALWFRKTNNSATTAWRRVVTNDTDTTWGINISGNAATVASLTPTTVGGNFLTLSNPGAIGFIRINADNTVSALNGAGFRSAIGATTVGDSLFRLTDPSAITFLRVNANNTVSALSAADFRTAIGAGTSSTTGTVTSVASGDGLTGGTITTTGTLAVDSSVVRTSGDQTIGGSKTFSSALFVNKAAQAAGADSYHMELFAPDSGTSQEISMRFHQGNRFYHQIRARAGLFRFTQGNSDSLVDVYASTFYGALSGNASTATTAANSTLFASQGEGQFIYGDSGRRRGVKLITDWNQSTHPDVAFLSSENSTTNAPSTDYTYGLQYAFHRDGAAYRTQIVTSLYSNPTTIWIRNSRDSDVWTSWYSLVHSGNITSQAVNYANSAGNADTVDSLHASAFMRSAGTENAGTIIIRDNRSTSNYYNEVALEIRSSDQKAIIGLHRDGYSHCGIAHETVNQLRFNFNSGNVYLNHDAGTIIGTGNYSSYALPLGGGTLTGNIQLGNNQNVLIRYRTASAWDYYLSAVNDDFSFYDSQSTLFFKAFYNGGGTGKYIEFLGVLRVNNDNTVNVNTSSKLRFGSQTRQMIDLWGTQYGIGIQSSTTYFRSDSRFSWHRGGSHSDNENNAGGGTVAMTLDGNSNLVVTGNVTAYSDIKIKRNIQTISDALKKVQKIRGVTFTRIDDDNPEKRHAGVIAQEVEKVLPEVVGEDISGTKYVAYGNMVGLLIEAIKEQQSEIDTLKQQISLLTHKE